MSAPHDLNNEPTRWPKLGDTDFESPDSLGRFEHFEKLAELLAMGLQGGRVRVRPP